MINHPRRDAPMAAPLVDRVDMGPSGRRWTDPVLLMVRTAAG